MDWLWLERTSRVVQLLLKQNHIKPVAHDHIQTASEDLQEVKFHYLSGQPLPMLGYLNSKKVFPDVQMEPPVLQSVLSVSCHGMNEKSLAPIFFALSLQIFIYTDKIPLSLLVSWLNTSSSQLFLTGEML